MHMWSMHVLSCVCVSADREEDCAGLSIGILPIHISYTHIAI